MHLKNFSSPFFLNPPKTPDFSSAILFPGEWTPSRQSHFHSPFSATISSLKIPSRRSILADAPLGCSISWKYFSHHTCPEALIQLSELVKRLVNRFLVQFVYILRDCKD